MYQQLLKPLLFQFPAERAHRMAFGALRLSEQLPLLRGLLPAVVPPPKWEREFWGLKFRSPIGLAAGFDKNAELVDTWEHFGFGFLEVGTVTPRPQPGNPKPRMFRLPQDRALINRLGFNNEGMEKMKQRLEKRKTGLVVGGNIGKNKSTPNAEALEDYKACMQELFEVVDYFTVNVSSPNTPGLRDLQEKKPLTELLLALQEINHAQPQTKPLLLKIAPDLTDEQLDDIIEIYQTASLSGLIATNTTISRQGLQTPKPKVQAIGQGGLSGAPLRERANEVTRYLRRELPKNAVLIGVGGIDSPKAARQRLEAGADLLQVYTGFVYGGPYFVQHLLNHL